MAKSKFKQRRIRAVDNDEDRPSKHKSHQKTGKSRKKGSNFANDLTDTSRSAIKRLRYDANRVQKGKGLPAKGKGKAKPGLGKSNKGKTFGKPQAPKSNGRRKK